MTRELFARAAAAVARKGPDDDATGLEERAEAARVGDARAGADVDAVEAHRLLQLERETVATVHDRVPELWDAPEPTREIAIPASHLRESAGLS